MTLTERVRPGDNSSMDDKATKRGGGAVVVMVLVVVLLLPMIYVLSVGPAIWLAERGRLSEQSLTTTYGPLEWTANNVPVVGLAITWYVEWWQTPQLIYSAPTLPSTATNPPPALPATAIAPAPAALPAAPPATASP